MNNQQNVHENLVSEILVKYQNLILSQVNIFEYSSQISLNRLEEYSMFIATNKNSLQTLLKDKKYKYTLQVGLVNLICSIVYKQNQFIELSAISLEEINKFYISYLDKLFDRVTIKHYQFLFDLFSKVKSDAANLANVNMICSEYSADFQLKVLSLNVDHLKEPILDIGCGKNMTLVKFLKQMGYDAVGIDRDLINRKNDSQFDWFTFDYKNNYWGTIISQMAFSNHFIFNHLYKYGKPERYAKLYMTILASLKSLGSFYYTPGLPFIERLLSEDKYQITKKQIDRINYNKEYLYNVKILKKI